MHTVENKHKTQGISNTSECAMLWSGSSCCEAGYQPWVNISRFHPSPKTHASTHLSVE